ncbi:hypothetical protein ACS0TY_019003 [Phlomoides rotata]
MSLIARIGHHGSFKHICSSIVASSSLDVTRRPFAHLATLDGDVEQVEIDQRLLPSDYDPANFDPRNHRRPPTKRVWRLVDEMAGITLAEAAELSDIMFGKFCNKLMKKLTIKERLVIMARVAEEKEVLSVVKDEKKAEKTIFELRIESYEAASKLKVIKEIRNFVSLGLKEAKDLVEKAPAILKKGVSKEEGNDIIEKMKAVGAKVVME